jgi:hypothetical protein
MLIDRITESKVPTPARWTIGTDKSDTGLTILAEFYSNIIEALLTNQKSFFLPAGVANRQDVLLMALMMGVAQNKFKSNYCPYGRAATGDLD